MARAALVLGVLLLAGCRMAATASPPPASPQPTVSPTVTPPPTATPPPLAARVNGYPITLAEYQVELALYQAALGKELATEERQRVLDDLIDQALLAQDAIMQGFDASEAALQERMAQLSAQLGGAAALAAWQAAHGFDDETFARALRRSMAAAWMRDQIARSVPRTAEQIHARQILLYSREEAERVLAELATGADFTALAEKYDPVTRGDLGWFPRGFLLDPQLEEAAFALQPGQYSPILQTVAGYHILLVLERDPQRPLDPQALLKLQRQAVQTWLEQRRQTSQIEIYLSEG